MTTLRPEATSRALEREATAALFQIGNRMVSGLTFERALQDAAASDKGAFQRGCFLLHVPLPAHR